MKKIIAILLLILIAGCNLYSEENQELRNELRQTEIELSSIMGSPHFMFGEAFDLVDQEDFPGAVAKLEMLQHSFPDWNSGLVEEFIERFAKN